MPIGQRLRPGGTMPWLRVIGVARDVKQAGVDQPVRAEAYVLVDQVATPTLTSSLSITPTTMHVVIRSPLPFVAVAAVASWFPAWRASRLDPIAVLRAD